MFVRKATRVRAQRTYRAADLGRHRQTNRGPGARIQNQYGLVHQPVRKLSGRLPLGNRPDHDRDGEWGRGNAWRSPTAVLHDQRLVAAESAQLVADGKPVRVDDGS